MIIIVEVGTPIPLFIHKTVITYFTPCDNRTIRQRDFSDKVIHDHAQIDLDYMALKVY